MTMPTLDPVAAYALRLADDALIHGQRLSEWCGKGPFLEEDLALASTALDYIGRARALYRRAGRAVGLDDDGFAFSRDVRAFTNLLLFELPRGDFATTIVRQFLLDAFEGPFLEALARSSDETLAAIGREGEKETRYHVRHSREWVLRLGDGTPESHQRAQQALDEQWGYLPELFEMDVLEAEQAALGVAVDRRALETRWLETVAATLEQATLAVPEATWSVRGGREGTHTEHLGYLLAELQFVQRAYPGMTW